MGPGPHGSPSSLATMSAPVLVGQWCHRWLRWLFFTVVWQVDELELQRFFLGNGMQCQLVCQRGCHGPHPPHAWDQEKNKQEVQENRNLQRPAKRASILSHECNNSNSHAYVNPKRAIEPDEVCWSRDDPASVTGSRSPPQPAKLPHLRQIDAVCRHRCAPVAGTRDSGLFARSTSGRSPCRCSRTDTPPGDGVR